MKHQEKLKKYGVELNDKGHLKCELCGEFKKHLGSHLHWSHNIKSRQYKKEFDLPYSLGLISQDLHEKIRDNTDHAPTWKENFGDADKNYFEKGRSGKRRVTEAEAEIVKERCEQMREDMKGECPVCDKHYDHVPNHLFKSHGLIQVKGFNE